MRVLSALRSPAITSKETGAMATVFARPKLQLFGVSTTFVVRKINLSDLGNALRLGWEDFKAIPTHAVVLCVIYPVLACPVGDRAGSVMQSVDRDARDRSE